MLRGDGGIIRNLVRVAQSRKGRDAACGVRVEAPRIARILEGVATAGESPARPIKTT